jgi:hypothetical protein
MQENGKFFVGRNILAIAEAALGMQLLGQLAENMLCHPKLFIHMYRQTEKFLKPKLVSQD